MIIGHLGIAFAARARWPRLSVWWLLLATMAPDILRGALLVAGVSRWQANQYSHALPWSGLLALALGAVALAATRNGETGVVTAIVVCSHLVLDALSGQKAVWDGGPPGMNLQRYIQLEFVIEAALAWWGWRRLRRSPAPTWLAWRSVLAVLLLFEAGFQAWSLEQRPYATRCWVWPLESCWTWRGERPPA